VLPVHIILLYDTCVFQDGENVDYGLFDWDAICNLVGSYHCFRGKYQKMGAIRVSDHP
jgi:hypothetical protein